MESKAAENLLEKYLEGETSVQEENKLRAYFTSRDVAAHLEEYIPLFSYFEVARNEKFPRKNKFYEGRKKVYSWIGVAASLLILIGIFTQHERNISEFGSYEDPELAMQKTKEALNMVSQLMNTGQEELKYLHEFNNTKNELLKN